MNLLFRPFWFHVLQHGVTTALPGCLRAYLVGSRHATNQWDTHIDEFEELDDLYPSREFIVSGVRFAEDEMGVRYIAADDCDFVLENKIPRSIYGVLLATTDGLPVGYWHLSSPVHEGHSLRMEMFGALGGKAGKMVSFVIE